MIFVYTLDATIKLLYTRYEWKVINLSGIKPDVANMYWLVKMNVTYVNIRNSITWCYSDSKTLECF